MAGTSDKAPLPFAKLTGRWAWGGADGAGVKVAVLDSGIDAAHPDLRGAVAGGIEIELAESGKLVASEGGMTDAAGHGTACAGIVHRLAPAARIYSVRVLGPAMQGLGAVFLGGLHWAISEGIDVINLSLGTTNREYTEALHELADAAFFRRSIIVAAANNESAPSFPSVFSNLLGVRSCPFRTRPRGYPVAFTYSPGSPIEIGAPGDGIRVPWPGAAHKQVTGNSFACPHVTGLAALILSKHPDLTAFQLQTVLHRLSLPASGSR